MKEGKHRLPRSYVGGQASLAPFHWWHLRRPLNVRNANVARVLADEPQVIESVPPQVTLW